MAKTQCTTIVEHGRINLIISKGEKGYDKFKEVLDSIEQKGFFCWYGDVEDLQSKERSGLVITSKGE